MSVSLACSCGKRLRVSDDYAGQRIKCPSCGERLNVPDESDSEPDEVVAMIRFSCDCGKLLQAQAENAGKMTRCPACGSKQVIPDEDEEPQRRETDTRIRSGPAPAKKSVKAPPQEEEEEDEPRSKRSRRAHPDEDEKEQRRKRRRKKQKRAVWPMVVGGVTLVLLLLGGVGFAGYWFFFRGAGTAELAFIPPDAQGFVSIRLAEVSRFDGVQKLLKAQGRTNPLDAMTKEFGVAPGDVERITFVFQDPGQQDPGKWAVLVTTKAYDQKAFLQKMSNLKQVTHEGKTFHVGERPGGPGVGPSALGQGAVYFAGPRLLVLAPDETGMKRALTASARKNVTGPLASAIKQIGGSQHLYGSFAFPPDIQQQLRRAPGMLPGGKGSTSLFALTAMTLSLEYRDPFQMEVSFTYPDESSAQKAKTDFDGLKGLVNQLPMPGGQDKNASEALQEVLGAIQSEQRGTQLIVRLKVAQRSVDALLNTVPGQPRFPGPGPRR